MRIIILLLCLLCGCRMACYVAIGPQEVDEVDFKLTNQKADPNLAEAGEFVGAVLKGVL